MGNGVLFPEAVDVIADVCRETGGAEFRILDGARSYGYANRDFTPIGQANHHTGRGGWVPLVNFIHHGSSIAPLANGMTSNPYETDGKVIVLVTACGRANHAGAGVWPPDIPTNRGNEFLWGWEHQHSGGPEPWHPLHREVILRLNVGMNLAFGWKAHNVPDHKDYAPTRKVDRAHENSDAWRSLIQARMNTGHHSGHVKETRTVELKRLAGSDWYDTVAKMNKTRFRQELGSVMYVVVRDTPEASRVAAMGTPWAEVSRTEVPKATADLIRHFKPTRLVVLGGVNAVPDRVAQECKKIAENA